MSSNLFLMGKERVWAFLDLLDHMEYSCNNFFKKVSLPTNSYFSVFLGQFLLTDISPFYYFPAFFGLLCNFFRIPDIVSFTLWSPEYFHTPFTMVVSCFGTQFSFLEIIWSFSRLLLLFFLYKARAVFNLWLICNTLLSNLPHVPCVKRFFCFG